MTLYYLNPDDEPRECPGCIDCVTCCEPCRARTVGNPECGGTRRLGIEGKEPEIRVSHGMNLRGECCWYSHWREDGGPVEGWPDYRLVEYEGPTETEALAAARAALKSKP